MPSLTETLRKSSPAGFKPTDAPNASPVPRQLDEKGSKYNPSIRTPLPPFSATTDTLKQFNEDGSTPQRRVVPLPFTTGMGGNTTVNNNTTVIQGSGGGTTVITGLTSQSVGFTTPILAAGSSVSGTIVMSKSFQLLSLTASAVCEVRLYGDSVSQSVDASRLTDVPLAAEVFNGLISDIVFDTSPFMWAWQNRVGVNGSSPQSPLAYITVFNTGSTPNAIAVSIVFLPLET